MTDSDDRAPKRLTIKADEIAFFDLLEEGEVVRTITFGAMRPQRWPDQEYRAIQCEVGVMRIEDVETGIPEHPTLKAPAWDSMHERWFDFGEEVTVMRDWMPRAGDDRD